MIRVLGHPSRTITNDKALDKGRRGHIALKNTPVADQDCKERPSSGMERAPRMSGWSQVSIAGGIPSTTTCCANALGNAEGRHRHCECYRRPFSAITCGRSRFSSTCTGTVSFWCAAGFCPRSRNMPAHLPRPSLVNSASTKNTAILQPPEIPPERNFFHERGLRVTIEITKIHAVMLTISFQVTNSISIRTKCEPDPEADTPGPHRLKGLSAHSLRWRNTPDPAIEHTAPDNRLMNSDGNREQCRQADQAQYCRPAKRRHPRTLAMRIRPPRADPPIRVR